MANLVNTIRAAIEASGESRYAISKATGVAQSQLSRLVSGESGLSVETVERLADYLGLEIVVRAKTKRKDR